MRVRSWVAGTPQHSSVHLRWFASSLWSAVGHIDSKNMAVFGDQGSVVISIHVVTRCEQMS